MNYSIYIPIFSFLTNQHPIITMSSDTQQCFTLSTMKDVQASSWCRKHDGARDEAADLPRRLFRHLGVTGDPDPATFSCLLTLKESDIDMAAQCPRCIASQIMTLRATRLVSEAGIDIEEALTVHVCTHFRCAQWQGPSTPRRHP